MLVALTGLHGSGKSFFAEHIPPKFGFTVVNKNKLIENIYKNEIGSNNWQEWYNTEFNNNIYNITKKIVSYIPSDKDVVLDAVHNNIEWQVIKSIVPNAVLALITTPEFIRRDRLEENDSIKDIKRIKYWHNNITKKNGCLLSDADWSFNGGASLQVNEISFKALIELLYRKEQNRDKKDYVLNDRDINVIELMQQNKEINIALVKSKIILKKHNSDRKDEIEYER